MKNLNKALLEMGKQIAMLAPASKIFATPFSYNKRPIRKNRWPARKDFTMPYDLAMLYIKILKYEQKIIKYKRGIKFCSIYLSNNSSVLIIKIFKERKPLIIGNIFS